jgi:RimJ/RimL family protein N-acetyltransferase
VIESGELVSARLRLRPYVAGDLPEFTALMCDPEVQRYVGDGVLTAGEAAALFAKLADVYREHRFGVWAVELRESAGYTGHAELKPRAGEAGLELVYLLARSAWGRGLGTELARALRDHALESLRCTRVIATLHPDNEASQRVLQRLGFGFERAWLEPGDAVSTCLWANPPAGETLASRLELTREPRGSR